MTDVRVKKESSRNLPPVHCPRCASDRTVQVDEHLDILSFFCMDCEHTWTATVPQRADALLLLPCASAPPCAARPRASVAMEAIRRASATCARARVLVSIATDLLQHAVFVQQRLALIRRAANAVH